MIKEKDKNVLILPLATIGETGNHIAHCDDGNVRRNTAERFAGIIAKTVNSEAPWRYYSTQFSEEELLRICRDFPDSAMRGMGFGDLSIIHAYNKYKDDIPRMPIRRIRIWSIDSHLDGIYDEELIPKGLRNRK